MSFKDWLGRYLFPGSGRHAHSLDECAATAPPAETSAEDQLLEQLAAMAAGEAFRRQYTPEEQVAADVETNNDLAPWTRPLIGGSDD